MTHRTLFLTQRGERHQQDALRAAPPELELVIRRDPGRAELLRLLPDMEFLVSERSGSIDAALIAAGRNLRLIQRLGSQTWDIDLDAARRAGATPSGSCTAALTTGSPYALGEVGRGCGLGASPAFPAGPKAEGPKGGRVPAGIPVCSWPLRDCVLVAEHMLLQMLATARRLRELMHISAAAASWAEPRQSDEDTFAYNWSRRRDVRGLEGCTVGILGFGEIGWELAKRLRAFDCAVLYYKRRLLPPQAEHALGISYAAQPDLIRHSDFVCSLLPLSDATRQLANAAFFAAMKPGSIFLHCGAGGVVDEAALAAALGSGRLAGAALDTYQWEPLRPDDPLVALARDPQQNLILTPHVAAGAGAGGAARRASEYTNLLAVLSGRPLLHRVA